MVTEKEYKRSIKLMRRLNRYLDKVDDSYSDTINELHVIIEEKVKKGELPRDWADVLLYNINTANYMVGELPSYEKFTPQLIGVNGKLKFLRKN